MGFEALALTKMDRNNDSLFDPIRLSPEVFADSHEANLLSARLNNHADLNLPKDRRLQTSREPRRRLNSYKEPGPGRGPDACKPRNLCREMAPFEEQGIRKKQGSGPKRLPEGQGVAGSNPVSPTIREEDRPSGRSSFRGLGAYQKGSRRAWHSDIDIVDAEPCLTDF